MAQILKLIKIKENAILAFSLTLVLNSPVCLVAAALVGTVQSNPLTAGHPVVLR